MIIPNAIRKIVEKKYSRKVDFVTDMAEGFGYKNVNGKLCAKTCGFNPVEKVNYLSSKPLKTYYENDRLFVYCNNKKLYGLRNATSWQNVCLNDYASAPFIGKIICDQVEGLLVGVGTTGEIAGVKTITFEQTVTEASVIYRNRLITANNGCVFYSEDVECLKNSTLLSFGLLLKTPKEIGEILKIFVISDIIYLVGKHGVCIVKDALYNDSFICKTLAIRRLNVERESVHNYGKALFLVSDGMLCRITASGIDEYDVFTDGTTYKSGSTSGKMGAYYLCPVTRTDSTSDYALVFNTEDKTSRYVVCMQHLAPNGYCVQTSTYRLYQFTPDKPSVDENCYWKSKRIDMGNSKMKRLHTVRFYAEGECALVMKGEFGTRTFSMQPGLNKIACNYFSSWYEFELDVQPSSLPIAELKLEYCLRGKQL